LRANQEPGSSLDLGYDHQWAQKLLISSKSQDYSPVKLHQIPAGKFEDIMLKV